MIEAQFSVLEILTISAGRFGTAQLAAQSVLVTVTSTSFNIPFPLAIATSTRVANLIGAQLSDAARKTARVVRLWPCLSQQPLLSQIRMLTSLIHHRLSMLQVS